MNMLLHFSYGKSDFACSLSPQIVSNFLSTWWSKGPLKSSILQFAYDPSKMCVVNPLPWVHIATCWMVTNWFRLKTCLWTFRQIIVQAYLKHLDSNWSDVLKYQTYLKHMYSSILHNQSVIWINSAHMKH
jgi:hypothetical protein